MGIFKEKKKNASPSATSPCSQLREAYHNCFNRWYSDKFLKGEWNKEECVIEWKKYRDCLSGDVKCWILATARSGELWT
ncbi:uncharacterized protein At4g33100 isoform X2 [Lycium barbarum]|uniref:uncharacterized protein At4g33100 isoform X2 n=1 Tax=Lycium barbarum TaxID=112863 RepID=UPI00293F3F10|nr:uncharacterized protein At4g33100 isoform X2 [Lycium barbarum]